MKKYFGVYLLKLDFDVCIPTKRGVSEDLLTSVKKETTGKIYISKSTPLTFARMELIARVETPFFLFLDDDIVYPAGLLQRLYSFFDEKVGAVQGSTIPSGLGTNFDKALSKGRYDSPTSKITRIMTSNALIRTSTVRDWNPTNDVSGIEDMHLTEHIRNKGFLCIVIPQNVKHFTSWKKARRNGLIPCLILNGSNHPNRIRVLLIQRNMQH